MTYPLRASGGGASHVNTTEVENTLVALVCEVWIKGTQPQVISKCKESPSLSCFYLPQLNLIVHNDTIDVNWCWG